MGGLFSKPKKVKTPLPPSPAPTVESALDDETTTGFLRKLGRGRRKTILTGNIGPDVERKTLLG